MLARTTPNESIRQVKIFDFDETLYRVPAYASREATGLTTYQWYDSPCSLDQELNPRRITTVADQVNPETSLNYLITRRVPECKDAVMELLTRDGLEFDDVFFIGREMRKVDILVNLVKTAAINRVTIYEDSLWEISQYAKELVKYTRFTMMIKVGFKFVDKTKVIDLSLETAFAISNSNSFEKIKLA